MSTFGERVKELRLDKCLTQQELANFFYLNKSSISRYEKNKQIPELETLEKLSDFFEVSLDYLLGKSHIKNPEAAIKLNTSNSISTKGLSAENIKLINTMVKQLKSQN
ncbi:MAG: helix-turn-helix transcriptional regulator [Acidaminobacteraceae bacterium]